MSRSPLLLLASSALFVVACGGSTGSGGGTGGTTGGTGGTGTGGVTSTGGTGGTTSAGGTTSTGGTGGTTSTGGTGGTTTNSMMCDPQDPMACEQGDACFCGGPGANLSCSCGSICSGDQDCTDPMKPVCCGGGSGVLGVCTDSCTCFCD